VARKDEIVTSTGCHVLFHADSRECRFTSCFDLLLTSPPYYHPVRTSSCHGIGFTGDLEQYAENVASVLINCSNAVLNRRVCIVKTDVWYRGALIPIGYEIARACARKDCGYERIGYGNDCLRFHRTVLRSPISLSLATRFHVPYFLGSSRTSLPDEKEDYHHRSCQKFSEC
jgi:hypothetical protein